MEKPQNRIHPTEIICKPLEKLIKAKTPPALFIGSGFSKRYLKDYPSWLNLLERIGLQIGLSQQQILAKRQKIQNTYPTIGIGKVYQKLASDLESIFVEKVDSGSLNLSDFFTEDEIANIYRNNISFFKMLVAKFFQADKTFIDKGYLRKEIESFKELVNKVSTIITTNYDTLIEKVLFEGRFITFSSQEDYYFPETYGIGEVYKIHGTEENPKTLIITEQDYSTFNENKKLIIAKLLTLLCESPIVFLGYSLDDENIQDILLTLISCLSQSQINQISKNLIYISWENTLGLNYEIMHIVHQSGRVLPVTSIRTNNFLRIYEYLKKFTPAEPPYKVRKYRQMISEVIKGYTSGNKTVIVNSDKLEELSNYSNLVIAFENRENEKLVKKGVTGLNKEQIILDALFRKGVSSSIADEIITEWYDEHAHIGPDEYLPLFYYCKKSKLNPKNYSEKLKRFIDHKLAFINNIPSDVTLKSTSVRNCEDLQEYASSETKLSKIVKAAIKSYVQGDLGTAQYIELLQQLHAQGKSLDTDFRKAILLIDADIKK